MKKITNDHRTRVTKSLIIKAFASLIKEKPLHSITIIELCKQAEINRGTFYTHYTDIYDLLHQIEAEMTENFVKVIDPLLHIESLPLRPGETTAQIIKYIKENPDLCTITLGEYSDRVFTLELINYAKEEFITSYSSRFENMPPKKVAQFCTFVCSGCIGLLQEWYTEGMTSSLEDIAETAEEIILMGVDFFK